MGSTSSARRLMRRVRQRLKRSTTTRSLPVSNAHSGPSGPSISRIDRFIIISKSAFVPAQSVHSLMESLGTIIRSTCRPRGATANAATFQVTTVPTATQQRALDPSLRDPAVPSSLTVVLLASTGEKAELRPRD